MLLFYNNNSDNLTLHRENIHVQTVSELLLKISILKAEEEAPFKCKDIRRLKVKEQKTIYYDNTNEKKLSHLYESYTA